MGKKLERKQYPAGTGPDDFECFGPMATEDGQFDACKLADLGCFNQSGIDSNKYYFACQCRNRKTGKWYAYFEWGRTGGKGDFQFVECSDENDAQYEFSKQLHDKNDKRGEWVTKPGLGRVLQAKAGKDCYLVRPLATRDVGSPGLPGARSIAGSEVKITTKKAETTKKKTSKKKDVQCDPETMKLMRDFSVATIQYTKTSIQGGTIPAQKSIDEGRIVLTEAQKRIIKVGDNLDAQLADKDLRDLTFHLYSRIPKVKPVGAAESTWILSKDNIFAWQQDLDAFEAALAAAHVEIEHAQDDDFDPFGGMKIKMRHLGRGDESGEWLKEWMPKATKNVHYNIGGLKIHNAWEVEREGIKTLFDKRVQEIANDKPIINERLWQTPKHRPGLDKTTLDIYERSNVGLCFHGTRSVNVTGILREGLRFPKELVGVVITGAMFGPGHYWAPDFKKSVGYTSQTGSYWSAGSGAVRGREAFMFVAEVCLGRGHVAKGSYGYTSPPSGCHSVFGKANVSGVQNDEWITFNKNQYQFKYLVEFSTK